MRQKKASATDLRRHNRQLLLRAVYSGQADSRAALAQLSGLTKPTVSSLVGELIEEGFLSEQGRGSSTDSGGKPPRLLEFRPDARQVIGVALGQGVALGVLTNLAGSISAQHQVALCEAEAPTVALQEVVNALLAQLDSPLLCLGVAVPGAVDTDSGVVRHAPGLAWQQLPLAETLKEHYEVPAYVGNHAELCALAQFAFGNGKRQGPRNLVTVTVDHGPQVGVVLGQGSYHHGGDISCLQLSAPREGAAAESLGAALSWEATATRALKLRQQHSETLLPEEDISYMHLRYAAALGDALAQELQEELAASLAGTVSWVIGLLQPDEVSLAGPIADLGEAFLTALQRALSGLLPAELLEPVSFSLAYSGNLSAIGAVALALQKELAVP